MAPNAPTPMLKQYWQIKADYPDPDTILFFRLGDFYEMFYDDAVVAAQILEITLTTRNKNDPEPIPLCGVPYHAAEGYIAKLIAAGKKVAICEQVEDPKTAKGVVKRDVVRVITPGAVFAPESLSANDANFLLAIARSEQQFGLAALDISTGTWRATQLGSWRAVCDELERIEAREVLLMDDLPALANPSFSTTVLPDDAFTTDRLPTAAGCADLRTQAPVATLASNALWHYIAHTKLANEDLAQLVERVELYQPQDYVVIDEITKRNLELCKTLSEHSHRGSLLWLLDRTHTAMGARKLKSWMLYPLAERAGITARQDAVATFLSDITLQQRSTERLKAVADLERIAGRIITGNANPRDFIALRDSLVELPNLSALFSECGGLLQEAATAIDPCNDIAEQIQHTLTDEPPIQLKDGGIIRDGFDAELDELRALQHEGKTILAALEAKERESTGISSLKIRYNKVFGYYLEVTHTHKDKVPAHYIRKQTLTNAERYITEELKQLEERILTAKERSLALEHEHFANLRSSVATHATRLKRSADQVATIDCLRSFATIAAEYNYARPSLVDEPVLEICEGRHPVIEQLLQGEQFVPNDCQLGGKDQAALLIITGPNMAGKSTIMRQVALITLMAHMGSFVPASNARIGVTDRIFTRVGASDNLVKGQSTFMVEMSEVGVILHEATERSVLLIDELGRGTSTYDGISIAWAVTEYLHGNIAARTLFATHYHELAQLADELPGVANVTMAVKEWNDQIIFLRKLIPGAADRSYGIEVARLAGLPDSVTARARILLKELESDQRHQEAPAAPPAQFDLFTAAEPHPAIDTLRSIDPMNMTPLEALQILTKLRGDVNVD